MNSMNEIIASMSGGRQWRTDFEKYVAVTPVAGRWYDYTRRAGVPAINPYTGSALTATTLDDSNDGAMYHGGDQSGTKHIIDGEIRTIAGPNMFMLCDFLMFYPTINFNSATKQSFTNVNTLPRYTDGKGVRMFLVTTVAIGATGHNVAVTYTNTEDEEKTLPVTVSGTVSSPVDHILHSGTGANMYGPFMPLAAGDVGIKSVKDITLSKASGTSSARACLVLCRPLMYLPVSVGYYCVQRELVNEFPPMPRIYDGAYLGILGFIGALTYRSTFSGHLTFGWTA